MFKKIGIASILLISIGLLVLAGFSSDILLNRIYSEVEKGCPKCHLQIDKLHLTWIPLSVVVTGVTFDGDPAPNPVVNFKLDRAEAHFELLTFLGEAPTLDSLAVEGIHVVVRERVLDLPDTGPPYPPPGAAVKFLPPIRVNQIKVAKSRFTYQHVLRGKVGQIDVMQVNAEAGPFVSRDYLLEPKYQVALKMGVTGRLENSGKVKIEVVFDPFAQKNKDHILISLHEHNLATMNKFFKNDDGVLVEGQLLQGTAELEVKESKLSGTFTAAYSDLKISYESTKKRSPVESFLSNFVSAVATSKTRPRVYEKTLPEAPVSAERKPHEAITKLLIRGLTAAALKILTG